MPDLLSSPSFLTRQHVRLRNPATAFEVPTTGLVQVLFAPISRGDAGSVCLVFPQVRSFALDTFLARQ